jgi:diguanylate cyclase (GGDEF)-like protein
VAAELAAVVGTAGSRQLEASLLTNDGHALPVSLSIVDVRDDQTLQGLLVVAHDVSALVEARGELRRLAQQDDLTGLPNRMSLRGHLERVMAEPEADAFTVLFGDVDGLKRVNDVYGHRAGDALLVAVAQRLRSVVRPEDFVARLSGDEFVVVVASADERVLSGLQGRIVAAMADPVVLPDGHRVATSISLGAAQVQASLEVEELLASADSAMYEAKRERGDAR